MTRSGGLTIGALLWACATGFAWSEPVCDPAPKDASGWALRGDCLRSQDQPGLAVDAYLEALRLEPEGFRILFYGLGLAYEDLDRGNLALLAFEQAEAQGGADADLHYHIGIAHEIRLDYDSALARFRQAVALRPDDNRAQRNIGFVLINQGNPEEAIPFLQAAIRIDRNDHKAWVNLGLAYIDTQEALRNDLKALGPIQAGPEEPDDPKVQARERLVEQLHGTDWFGKSIEALREAVDLAPSEPVYWYNLGTTLSERRRDREAIEALTRAVELEPDYYKALRNLTLAQQRVKDFQESYDTGLRILELAEGNDGPWLEVHLAGLERELGKPEAAEKRYRAVLVLDPDNVSVHLGLAILYQKQGRFRDSQDHLDRAIELRPDMKFVYEHAVQQSS